MSLGDLFIRLGNHGFEAIEALRRWFGQPKVEAISTSDLHAATKEGDSSPVLVDVRSDSERAVSLIPGAISQQQYEAAAREFAGRRLVIYCTVGGRSYLYARQLVASGVDAANYLDSILGWCRAVSPLESPDGQPTNAVHPYLRIFEVPENYDVQT